MQYPIAPHSKRFEAFVWWEGAFSEQELNWLQDKAKRAEQNAKIGGGIVNKDIRRSQVSWLNNDKDTEWVFKKLAEVVAHMNAEHYDFDLMGFGESLQLTNYDQSENGMYGWHQDFGAGPSRKLSLVVQLTDPAEYEGGNLQIMSGSQPQNVRKQRGLIAIFPSFMLHQVTPVTQGNRQSLVAWATGRPFK
jgi:PKHD-type hydroxylase